MNETKAKEKKVLRCVQIEMFRKSIGSLICDQNFAV